MGNSKEGISNRDEGVPYKPMIQEELSPCATLLYQWILRKVPGGTQAKLDIRDFQAWSAEFRNYPYSDREVLNGFKQLKQLELISISKTEVTIRTKKSHNGNNTLQHSAAITWLSRSQYFKPGLVLLLAVLSLGVLKFVPIADASTSTQSQLQNFKFPNPWNILDQGS